MTSYVAIVPVVLVARTNGATSTIGYGDPVPGDATSAAITHLLALSYIAVGGSVPPTPSNAIPTPSSGDAGKVPTVNEDEDGYALATPGGGGVPFADPTDVTTETQSDLAVGADHTVVVMPDEAFLLAVKVDGDDFPRLIFNAADGIWIGNGTFDPYVAGSGINATFDGHLAIYSAAGLKLQMSDGDGVTIQGPVHGDGDMTFDSDDTGPVVRAPDGSYHRLTVGNDGTPGSAPLA